MVHTAMRLGTSTRLSMVKATTPAFWVISVMNTSAAAARSRATSSRAITALGGSLGYLLKDRVADVSDFLDAIMRIGAGATVLDPEVVAQLLSRRTRDDRMLRLTDRESTVLALIAEGRSNQAIARTLHVSEGSVEKHITSVFQKLDLEQDESGNRRVLAALAHLSHGGSHPEPRPGGTTPQTGAQR